MVFAAFWPATPVFVNAAVVLLAAATIAADDLWADAAAAVVAAVSLPIAAVLVATVAATPDNLLWVLVADAPRLFIAAEAAAACVDTCGGTAPPDAILN